MAIIKVDLTGFIRKTGILARRGVTQVSRVTVEDAGKAAVRTFTAISPKDTHRYVAAWQRAGNDAGIGPITVDAIVKSKSYSKNFTKLKRQTEFWIREEKRWKRNLESYDRRHRKASSKSYRDAKAKYAKIVKLRDRAIQQYQLLDADPGTAIVIRGRNTVKATSLGQLATVRTKIYGGSAQWLFTGSNWILRLVNLEPHARIVEWGTSRIPARRIVSRVRSIVGVGGSVNVSTKKFRELEKLGLTSKASNG